MSDFDNFVQEITDTLGYDYIVISEIAKSLTPNRDLNLIISGDDRGYIVLDKENCTHLLSLLGRHLRALDVYETHQEIVKNSREALKRLKGDKNDTT